MATAKRIAKKSSNGILTKENGFAFAVGAGLAYLSKPTDEVKTNPDTGQTGSTPTKDEQETALILVQDPQIRAFITNNPPPSDYSSRGSQWASALTTFASTALPGLLGNINLPSGTPQVLAQLWEGVVEISEKGFTKDNILAWWGQNKDNVVVSGRDFIKDIFSNSPDPTI